MICPYCNERPVHNYREKMPKKTCGNLDCQREHDRISKRSIDKEKIKENLNLRKRHHDTRRFN